VRRTARRPWRAVPGGAMQMSSPVGTRPAFCAGSCPAARAVPDPFSRILAGQAPYASRTPAGSAEGPGAFTAPAVRRRCPGLQASC
jgi:hypothetical protein